MIIKKALLTLLLIIPLPSYGEPFGKWDSHPSGREFTNIPMNGGNVILAIHKPFPYSDIILPRVIFEGGNNCHPGTRGYYFGMGGLFINGTKETVELWCQDGHDVYTPANNDIIKMIIMDIYSEKEIRIRFSGMGEYIFDTTGGRDVLHELKPNAFPLNPQAPQA